MKLGNLERGVVVHGEYELSYKLPSHSFVLSSAERAIVISDDHFPQLSAKSRFVFSDLSSPH